MTPASVGPLSRPLPLGRVPAGGLDVVVEADEAERAALAADLGLVGLDRLVGRLHVTAGSSRVRVSGRVEAAIVQTCVVTLDEFPSEVVEDVDVAFAPPSDARRPPAPEVELDMAADEPDELAGDSIDLGAITAEFLALGLDPYPRKPGARFEAPGEGEGAGGPFAGLARLRDDGPARP